MNKSRCAAPLLLLIAFVPGLAWLRSQDAPPKPRPPVEGAGKAAVHPLDPLSRDELAAAVRILKDAGRLTEGALLPVLVLNEPPKDEVLRSRPGGVWGGDSPPHPPRMVPRREAFAVVFERGKNRTHEAVIDLRARKVLSWKELPGVHPAVLLSDVESATRLVRADPRWRAALRRRGIEDFDKVFLEPWAPGALTVEGAKGARLLRVLSFYQGKAGHPYGRPIEGLVVLVNATTQKVLAVQDTEVVPLPKDGADFFDAAARGPLRPKAPPLFGPARGAGFEVRGHEVRWQRWRFRYALHPREGLVLYTIGYEDEGRVRPILYRASLAELLVPYGDPADTWAWRSPLDEGEYGLGRLSVRMRRGHEVPDNAVLLDAVFADDLGHSYPWPRSVAVYEQDGGLLWTHTDVDSGRSETRRARQLVVSFIATLGNYDYVINWIFGQDGSLTVRVDLTGIVLAKAVAAGTCPACRQEPDADGVVRARGEDRFGTLVAKNRVAVNHQHFFCFRLDFDVDGVSNSVEELNVRGLPAGKDNPHGNAFVLERSRLRTERQARRDLSLASSRTWRVFNPGKRTPLGHFPAYVLEPETNAVPYARPELLLRRRAGFVDHPLWVTRYRGEEQHAAGPYPNQRADADGLPRWSGAEKIEDTDVVVWYVLGTTHVPHPEEWPVMPAAHAGFKLAPDGFFVRNPALDVP